MAEEARFFERQVDRTAYGACWGVAIFVLALWLLAGWGLWELGDAVRHFVVPSWQPHWPSLAGLWHTATSGVQHQAASGAATASQDAQATAKQQAQNQLNAFLKK
jgi:hypothetical protein